MAAVRLQAGWRGNGGRALNAPHAAQLAVKFPSAAAAKINRTTDEERKNGFLATLSTNYRS